jgi:glutathionyl-hydroquinone reductase
MERAQFPLESGADGSFQRQESAFRRWVRADGSGDLPAVAGRYHLYVSLACPWAHRVIIARKLKGLEETIGMSVVDPIRDDRGWAFRAGRGHGVDEVNGFLFLAEAYTATAPTFSGRVTVPVLWDKETRVIVNNESADLLRMLNSEFDAWGDASLDLYPLELREQIDRINQLVYDGVNNGVYRAGFAASQAAYEQAFDELFAALGQLEGHMTGRRFLVGERLTEADIRLFTTLVRFDAVYHGHFKCNLRMLKDHPHLWAYARRIYSLPGVAGTVDWDHIKRHYYVTHTQLNPSGIVPKGPALEW